VTGSWEALKESSRVRKETKMSGETQEPSKKVSVPELDLRRAREIW
jgi:hypothetical protein